MRFLIGQVSDAPRSTAYQAPRRATGVEWSIRASPPAFPLWLCVSSLADHGTIEWGPDHGDDGLYVVSGALARDDAECSAGGAVIVEAGVATQLRAIGPTEVVHVGGGRTGPSAPGSAVHVVGPDDRVVSGEPGRAAARWYADGTCAACDIQLFVVEGTPCSGGTPHRHSQDEIIYVLAGSVVLGAQELGPGAAICVPAGMRYALRAGERGHRFLNYRAGVSEQLTVGSPSAVLETAAARGADRAPGATGVDHIAR